MTSVALIRDVTCSKCCMAVTVCDGRIALEHQKLLAIVFAMG